MTSESARTEIEHLLKALDGSDKVSLALFTRRQETVDALRTALSALSLLEGKPLAKRIENSKKGMAWRPEDEELLIAEFDSGKDLDELSAILGRTQSSISLRLSKLGKNPE